MANTEDRSGHPPLERETADRLLQLLATDDGFRSTFEQDPATALREAGMSTSDVDAALAGATCMSVKQLASKEEIQASRAELQNYLTSVGTHVVVYCLEAGSVSESLQRKPRPDVE